MTGIVLGWVADRVPLQTKQQYGGKFTSSLSLLVVGSAF